MSKSSAFLRPWACNARSVDERPYSQREVVALGTFSACGLSPSQQNPPCQAQDVIIVQTTCSGFACFRGRHAMALKVQVASLAGPSGLHVRARVQLHL